MNALPSAATLTGTEYATTRFLVPGMRCAGCISKLEGRLPEQQGIMAARVNFGSKQVALTHDPALTAPELLEYIAAVGFDAQPLGPGALDAQSETKGLLKALAVSSFAAMNVMLLSVSIWSGAEGATREMFHWISALIGVPAIAYSGMPFFRSAWGALKRKTTNMDVPISIGISLTTGMSLFETAIGGQHAWFDGALMLCAFLLGGRVLDAMMRDKAREGVAALLSQAPTGAQVLDANGVTRWTANADIRPGMRILITTGERIAADGRVENGTSSIDRSLITGESVAIRCVPGDIVEAGALNVDAPITLCVTHAPEDSSLAEIARLMDAAGQARSRYMRIADRASRLYAPAVHTLALLSAIGWIIAGAGWHQALLIAVAVLLITCPCALGLAVPVAQVVASGALMRKGILVKDGSALERIATVDTALFDKTGTLTLGRPRPTGLEQLSPEQKSVALALAQASSHPLSRGLAGALAEEDVFPADVQSLHEVSGQGMFGLWQGRAVALERPQEAQQTATTSLNIEGMGMTVLTFHDPIRPDASQAITRLKHMGITSSILSGDSSGGVAPVAQALELEARAGLRPEEKLAAIGELEARGAKVLMIGDGLNDGPALAAATAALAPASATDVGRQAADMVFTGESLAAVPRAVHVSRACMKVVRQNFALAIGYNVLAVPLAIAGLVTPLVAALAMSLSSLIVIANALRLAGSAK